MANLYFNRQFTPLHWALIIAGLIILGGAIYSATTWNAQDNVATNGRHGPVNQIPDQTRMVQGIQAQPDTNNSLKSSSSVQVQPAAGGGASTQNAQPQPTSNANDYYYPRDPNYCGPGREMMCIAPQP